MSFEREEVSKLLANCHRRCCICHRFCGFKMETDHIIPIAKGGKDEIDNAIPVCFECHAEIHSYNNEHPRGRKFTSEELRFHREQWLDICDKHPEIFVGKMTSSEMGPLQALVSELEFNAEVAKRINSNELGALFMTDQFQRSIEIGIFWLFNDDTKKSLNDAYVTMNSANNKLQGLSFAQTGRTASMIKNEAQKFVNKAGSLIEMSSRLLKEMLPDVPATTS